MPKSLWSFVAILGGKLQALDDDDEFLCIWINPMRLLHFHTCINPTWVLVFVMARGLELLML